MFLKLGIDIARSDTQYPLLPSRDRDEFLNGVMELIQNHDAEKHQQLLAAIGDAPEDADPNGRMYQVYLAGYKNAIDNITKALTKVYGEG